MEVKDMNITRLDLSKTEMGNEEFKDLCENMNLKELKELFLGENEISDIKALEGLKSEKLEKLYL